MNNIRGNNRRRGRGNNRPQGGQQLNRIDSRARGNAPQLLEKYRKLAQDAHQNGDRVAAEYYLQFADHYFRVLADARVRQEEVRAQRDGRSPEGGDAYRDAYREDGDEGGDYAPVSDFPNFDAPAPYSRAPREDRPRDERPRDDRPREERSNGGRGNGGRDERSWRPDRTPQPVRDTAPAEADARDIAGDAGDADAGERVAYEPDENPFLRTDRDRGEARGTHSPREGRGLRPRREGRGPRDAGEAAPAGLDPASLPPAISTPRRNAAAEVVAVEGAAEEAPAPKRRTRRKAGDDAVEAAG